MKKIIIFICAFAVMLSLASSFSCEADDNLKEIEQNTPFRMTVLGDSIAAGYGLEGYDIANEPCYDCRSYANILAEKYDLLPGTTYYNDAHSGATTSDLINTIKSENIQNHLYYSDTILISIGGNDLLAVLWSALSTDDEAISGDGSGMNLDPAKIMEIITGLSGNIDEAINNFETDFNTAIDLLRELNPEALVIVNTIYDPFQGQDTFQPFDNIASDALQRINTIIKDNASDEDGNVRYTVSDVAQSFDGQAQELTNIASYDIHPSEQGHEAIATLLDTEITSHTFTTWIIDTSASAAADSQRKAAEKEEAKKFTSVMFGFFFMLVVMITVLFVHSLHKLKNE